MKLLTIKPITHELLETAVALDKLCFGGLWTKEAYQREIDSPNSSLLVLSYQQESEPVATNEVKNDTLPPKIIGLGCLWAIVDEAHLTLLGIHPHYRRQRLGQLLLCTLLQDAVDRHLKRATLEVNINNTPAISLYQKFGFKIAGRRKNYYQKTGEDALILWCGGLDRPQFEQELLVWQEQITSYLSYYY